MDLPAEALKSVRVAPRMGWFLPGARAGANCTHGFPTGPAPGHHGSGMFSRKITCSRGR